MFIESKQHVYILQIYLHWIPAIFWPSITERMRITMISDTISAVVSVTQWTWSGPELDLVTWHWCVHTCGADVLIPAVDGGTQHLLHVLHTVQLTDQLLLLPPHDTVHCHIGDHLVLDMTHSSDRPGTGLWTLITWTRADQVTCCRAGPDHLIYRNIGQCFCALCLKYRDIVLFHMASDTLMLITERTS